MGEKFGPLSKGWYVYAVNPIDWDWDMLLTVEDVRLRLRRASDDKEESTFNQAWAHVKNMAEKIGYDRVDRMSPRVFWVPDPDSGSFVYGFVWKQDNNGTTFVASRRQMMDLESSWIPHTWICD